MFGSRTLTVRSVSRGPRNVTVRLAVSILVICAVMVVVISRITPGLPPSGAREVRSTCSISAVSLLSSGSSAATTAAARVSVTMSPLRTLPMFLASSPPTISTILPFGPCTSTAFELASISTTLPLITASSAMPTGAGVFCACAAPAARSRLASMARVGMGRWIMALCPFWRSGRWEWKLMEPLWTTGHKRAIHFEKIWSGARKRLTG
ncbi:hypothetical protein D3C86_1593060 [compost metagenome]